MDLELRMQVLRAAVRDRQFLKASSHDLAATDFQNKAERIVAEIALKYYDTYGEPVGAMLRTDATALEKFYKLNEKEKKELRDLVDKIQGAGMELVSVRALQDRVMMIKKNTFFERALEEIIATEEKGRLSTQTLEDLVEKAQKELTERLFASSDFLEESEKRILRRQLQSEAERFPLLLIDPLDEKINLIGRGHFGIFVGPYSSGKSLFLLHTCLAYALQGLKVLYITLEDPIDVLENRADACITGLPMSKLAKLPNRFRKRYAELRQLIRGRIKFIDGTEGGVTVSKIEKMWEQEKASGFIADAIIIDYDEELECEKKFTGEMARKREFEEIYKRLRRMFKKLDVIGWTAAQTKRGTVAKRVIGGDDIGEDLSKAKKAFVAIGIGQDPDEANMKHLYVMRHRLDRSKFGVDVMTDFESAIAYDREETLKMQRRKGAA